MEMRFNQASGLAACRPLFECFDWLNASYDSPTTVPQCPQWQIKISCLMFIILSIRQDQVGLCNTNTRTSI